MNEKAYNLSVMSGCLQGQVPEITPDMFLYHAAAKIPVKAVNRENSVSHYGYLLGKGTGTLLMRVITSEGSSQVELPTSLYKVFAAKPLDNNIPRELGDMILVNDEIFTVVKHSLMFPIWVGDQNLVYYSEDIQSILSSGADCVLLS